MTWQKPSFSERAMRIKQIGKKVTPFPGSSFNQFAGLTFPPKRGRVGGGERMILLATMPPPSLQSAARTIYDYLAATDDLPDRASDAVIGFGTFDLRLARFCGDLHASGRAKLILFTGGIGAGTADLGQPEADAWKQELRRVHPAIDERNLITENRSTNTAENIRFTAELLEKEHPDFAFGKGIQEVIMVTSPSRLRRAWLTLRQIFPRLKIVRQLPSTNFEREYELYESKRIPYLEHLAGEIERIAKYSELGWIVPTRLPAGIQSAYACLKSRPRFEAR